MGRLALEHGARQSLRSGVTCILVRLLGVARLEPRDVHLVGKRRRLAQLVTQLGGEVTLDEARARGDVDAALLDGDEEQLVYDLSDWDAERRAELDGELEAQGIAHAFDEVGDLVVLAVDEERVDAIVDAIEFPDQLAADDTPDPGGLDAIETVGGLFVAADRLVHDPADTEGTLAAVDAARAMASMATPFGFAPPVWKELVEQAGSLQALLETEAEVVDDDAVVEAATALRAALRPYV